jgi:hypothetical protein
LNNDEALLYYIMCNVGAGVNWSNSFNQAKEKLDLGDTEGYKKRKWRRVKSRIY